MKRFIPLTTTLLLLLVNDVHGEWLLRHRGGINQISNSHRRKLHNGIDHDDYFRHDEYIGLSSDEVSNGCLSIENANNIYPGASLILGNCNQNTHWWRYDEDGLFHNQLEDDTMCMQAGHGGGGPPSHGTKMRLYPCDTTNELQQFDYTPDIIQLRDTNLCVVFQGVNGNIGKDPIILKSCEDSEGQDQWSPDYLD